MIMSDSPTLAGDLAALILAGGRSRRMGQNKALLRLRPDGPTLIELVLRAVAPLTDRILVSTNAPDAYAWLRVPLVPDRFAGCGPLAGLEAGLTANSAGHLILLGCDMPFVATDLLRYLASLRDEAAAVVPLNRAGQPEPLCAVYSQACLPVIRARLAAGRYQMSGWLDAVPVRFVPAGELEPVDPGLRSFRNLNTPADLAEA
jgi:molybdopterin-guanine dinucleotide biosynthesis protein A